MRTIAMHLTRKMSVRSPEEKKETLGTCKVVEVLLGEIELIRWFSPRGRLKM